MPDTAGMPLLSFQHRRIRNKMKKKLSKSTKARWITAYLFILPAFLFWLVWFFLPVCQLFALSFFQYNYAIPKNNHFVGLENYLNLVKDSKFHLAIRHSLTVVVIAVPIQTVISMIMALLINSNFKGRGLFRTLFYAPYVISSVAVATVFIYLFAQNQPVTRLFARLFGMENIAWSISVRYALHLVIMMFIWQQVGFYMIMYLSGLQSIPSELLEVAAIDGASKFQSFRYITWPLLLPTTFLVVTYGLIASFHIFDQISAVAGTGVIGSPGNALNTIMSFFYLNSFRYGDVGYGSAAAVFLFLMICIATAVQKKFLDKEV